MKKSTIATLFLSLALLSTAPMGAAQAESWDEPYTTVYTTGNSRAHNGYMFDKALMGHFLHVQDEAGGLVQWYAPYSGDYAFIVRCNKLSNDHFNLRLYRNEIETDNMRFERSDVACMQVIRNVKEGDYITWWDDDGTGRGKTLRDPIDLMVVYVGPSAE